jgi:NifU-like protein
MDTPQPAAVIADDAERLRVVMQVIEAARPDVQQDGGDIELIGMEGDRVRLRLTGACVGCAMAGHTLGTVRRRLMQALGEPVRVVPS